MTPILHFVSFLLLSCLATAATPSKRCPAVVSCLRRLDRGLDCPVLPVPARARLSPVPGGLPTELRLLRKGVWLFRDSAYNTLILRHELHLVLVDMPDSSGGLNKPGGSGTRLTDGLLAVMNGAIPKRIDLVYSHAHFDHIGTVRLVRRWISRVYPKAGVNIYGTQSVNKLIASSVSKRAISPTRLIRKSATIVLRKGLRINLKVLGGHTTQDLTVHIPRNGREKSILMFVDVVFPRWAPVTFLGISADIPGYIEVHDELLKFDFDIFLDGHLDLGTRADVVENRQYTTDLIRAANKAIRNLTDQDFADAGIANVANPDRPEFGNVYFAGFTASVLVEARKCMRIMIEKWGCRLGGVGVTMETNCISAAFYTRASQ